MNNKVTFSDAKVGDRVWSLTEGWGVVIERRGQRFHYPLNVKFEGGSCRLYTLRGRLHIEDHSPSLFWDEVKFEIPEKPLPQLEVDAKVFVWDQEGRKYKRHFSHFDEEGRMFAFNNGQTSFSSESDPEIGVTAWDKWELSECPQKAN